MNMKGGKHHYLFLYVGIHTQLLELCYLHHKEIRKIMERIKASSISSSLLAPSLFFFFLFVRIHVMQFAGVPSLAIRLPISSPLLNLFILISYLPCYHSKLGNWVGEAKILIRLWSGFWGITAACLFAFFPSPHQRKLREGSFALVWDIAFKNQIATC